MSLWIIIPGAIIAYLCVGLVVLIVMSTFMDVDEGESSQIAVFWPLVLIVGVVIGFHHLAGAISRKASNPELRERMRKRTYERVARAEARAADRLHSD